MTQRELSEQRPEQRRHEELEVLLAIYSKSSDHLEITREKGAWGKTCDVLNVNLFIFSLLL